MPSPVMSHSSLHPAPLHPAPLHPAIVARTAVGVDQTCYLQWRAVGGPSWVPDPAAATTFPSMREATRAATRLPSSLRAFGLLREPELAISSAH